MKMKTTIALAIMMIGINIGMGQNNPDIKRTMHWYFGYGAGLDFSSGSPVADTTGNLSAVEGCFVMSDTCGNLLFYGKNDTIYNKKNMMMDNGDLVPDDGSAGFVVNPTQIVTVPQPGNDSLFYIFYTSEGGPLNKLFYAIVNVNLNGGLGKVITKDNILLDTNVSEKVAAVKHCNGVDYWIVGKRCAGVPPDYLGASELFTFLLTINGIETHPNRSIFGKRLYENPGGCFKFSSNASYAAEVVLNIDQIIAADSSFIQLYQFNSCSGKFISSILIHFPCPYGIAFSPDNSKIYTAAFSSCLGAGIMDTLFLAQYDISVYDSASIVMSRVILKSGADYSCEAMQLGLDGKLYLCDDNYSDLEYSDKHLGVINYPNAAGVSCNYIQDALYLNGRYHTAGFPNFVDNYFYSFDYADCSTDVQTTTIHNNIAVYPNPANDYLFIDFNKQIDYILKIYSVTGDLLFQKTNFGNCQLNIQALAAGVYLIRIEIQDSPNTNLKFIKQ